MPIDIAAETIISLNEATQEAPGKPHLATVWRWCLQGCKGVKLESIVSGGRRYTSKEAVERFIAASTARANGEPAPTRTPKRRQRDITAAERVLEGAGI